MPQPYKHKHPGGVRSIGEDAFRYCRSLASISISSSVTSIGSYAFNYCNNIREIYNRYSTVVCIDKSPIVFVI